MRWKDQVVKSADVLVKIFCANNLRNIKLSIIVYHGSIEINIMYCTLLWIFSITQNHIIDFVPFNVAFEAGEPISNRMVGHCFLPDSYPHSGQDPGCFLAVKTGL